MTSFQTMRLRIRPGLDDPAGRVEPLMHAPFGLEYPLAAVTVLDAGGWTFTFGASRTGSTTSATSASPRIDAASAPAPAPRIAAHLAIGLSISEARENFREDRANAITLVTGRVPWRGPHATSRNRPRQLTRFPSGGTRRETEPVRGCSSEIEDASCRLRSARPPRKTDSTHRRTRRVGVP